MLENGRWRALGRVQTMPDGELETLEAHLLQGRIVLEQLVVGHRLGGGNRERLYAAGFDLLHGVGGLVAHDVHLAAQQGIHGRSGTAIRDRGHGFRGVDRRLPHQAAQMRRRAQTGVRDVELAGIGPDIGFEVAVGVGRQLGLADQRHRHLGDQAQELEVFQRLVLDVLVQGRRRRHANVVQQQGVAVRCCPRNLGSAYRATRAGGVFHHEVGTAAHRLAHRFAELACHQVGRPAGRERYHHGDRSGARETLRVGKDGGSRGGNDK